jgi:hypothetical protein
VGGVDALQMAAEGEVGGLPDDDEHLVRRVPPSSTKASVITRTKPALPSSSRRPAAVVTSTRTSGALVLRPLE